MSSCSRPVTTCSTGSPSNIRVSVSTVSSQRCNGTQCQVIFRPLRTGQTDLQSDSDSVTFFMHNFIVASCWSVLFLFFFSLFCISPLCRKTEDRIPPTVCGLPGGLQQHLAGQVPRCLGGGLHGLSRYALFLCLSTLPAHLSEEVAPALLGFNPAAPIFCLLFALSPCLVLTLHVWICV